MARKNVFKQGYEIVDREMKHNRIDLSLPAALGGFGVWWDKTHREHAAMIAQVSALMRAPRQVDSGRGPHNRHAS